MENSNGLKGFIERNGSVATVIFASLATFFTYSCMYAFRKAFGAADFKEAHTFAVFGSALTFKIAIASAQIFGYMLSKFMGIKFISEAGPGKRRQILVMLIVAAWLALLGFAIVPEVWKPLFMFLNGIPLGMVWGLVFSHIEGRRFTEMMGAILCTSFALASGFVKSIGAWLITQGVTDFWMPFATGAVFILPFLGAVWLLGNIPDPTAEDKQNRMERLPMTKAERQAILKKFAPGIILLIITYILLSAFRDFRDSFMKEIFKDIGTDKPENFANVELWVSILVCAFVAPLVFIKENKRAFFSNKALIIIGLAAAAISTAMYQNQLMGPIVWMVSTGFAVYLAYIPFNAFLFERFIAMYKLKANAGFLIYLADSFGYLGAVAVMLYKNFFNKGMNYASFFINANYILALVGIVCMLGALFYFTRKGQEVA